MPQTLTMYHPSTPKRTVKAKCRNTHLAARLTREAVRMGFIVYVTL
jgi:hypothetical protein